MSSLSASSLLAVAPSKVQAGPIALLVVVLLGVATFLLVRSMNNQLKKVPPSFDEPAAPDAHGEPGGRPGDAGDVPADPRTPGAPSSR